MTRTIDTEDRIGTEIPFFTPRRSSLLSPTTRARQMSSSLPPSSLPRTDSGAGVVSLFDNHDTIPDLSLGGGGGGGGVSSGSGRSVGRQSMQLISMQVISSLQTTIIKPTVRYTHLFYSHDSTSLINFRINPHVTIRYPISTPTKILHNLMCACCRIWEVPLPIDDLSNMPTITIIFP